MAVNDEDKRVGENVATLRGDMTQKALADAMRERGHKWSQATVWAVEKGDRPLKLVEAKDLAFILVTKLDQLIEEPRDVMRARRLQQHVEEVFSLRDSVEDVARKYERARWSLTLFIEAGERQGLGKLVDSSRQYADETVVDVAREVLEEVEAEKQRLAAEATFST